MTKTFTNSYAAQPVDRNSRSNVVNYILKLINNIKLKMIGDNLCLTI